MIILKFKAEGQTLKRTDIKNIVVQSRNELYAELELDEAWQDKEPITAQFANGDVVVDVFVENGRCIIPWEVLQDRGILKVALFGGDLITTNTVDISILSTGVIGGLVPTKASPSVYSYVVELSEQITTDWNNCKELLADYDAAVTESQNAIADLTARIEADFEQVHEELQESKDNVDKATGLLNDIETARDSAVSTINNMPVTKAMLTDDIYKPVNNLITNNIYDNTFNWERATSFNSFNLDAIFGTNKDRNINITLLEGHKYYVSTHAVYEKEYYSGKYSNITFNCNSINNGSYSAEAKRIFLADTNDYFDLAISGGNNYKAINYGDKKLISLHNIIAMKQDMTIITMALYQQGQGIDKTIPLLIYIIDVTDLDEKEISAATSNLDDYKQQEVIYLFAEPRLFAVEQKVKELENAIISLGGNV